MCNQNFLYIWTTCMYEGCVGVGVMYEGVRMCV